MKKIVIFAFLTSILLLGGCKTMNSNGSSEEGNDGDNIVTKFVEYQHEDTTLEGYLAYSTEQDETRPGILIAHEWTGLSDYEKGRARQLARKGYIVFSADIYGKNMRPESHKEAAEISGKFRKNRGLFRERVKAGLDVLRNHELSEDDDLAAIGYCFGGTAVLELARSGADVDGVVSFHGGLSTPNPEDAENIQAAVLVCHGANDPHVPLEDVHEFEKEMINGDVADWQVIVYGNTYHSFTNPDSGSDTSSGAAYNKQSDRRSWNDMMHFFDEIFSG